MRPRYSAAMFRRSPRQKWLAYAAAALAIIFLVRYFRRSSIDWDIEAAEDGPGKRHVGLLQKYEKWIVVTTIRQPTEALRALAAIPGWKMVVVGDRRTPKDWSLPDAIFLSVKAQKGLGYRIQKLLPYDSYTRKAIGYLYAIENGAKFIYETDDDNYVINDLQGFHTTDRPKSGLVLDTRNKTYNPYVHFGQPSVWPRGYPLDNIGDDAGHKYNLCDISTPAIQQGLVSGEADVDAIFRLTRQHSGPRTTLTFDSAAPPVLLPHGTFSPFNSQNTLFTARAFWALLLPTTVSDRATDIYRSYWAQKLLWLLGDNVAFYAPTSEQVRNIHSNSMDFYDENELYLYINQLVNFLHKWKCTQIFFFDCVSTLSQDLVKAGLWKTRDADLIDDWLADLANVGYASPQINKLPSCKHNNAVSIMFYPHQQITTMPHTRRQHLPGDVSNKDMVAEFVHVTCGANHYIKWQRSALHLTPTFPDITLVVNVKDIQIIPAIEAIYKPYFPSILYCIKVDMDSKTEAFLNVWKVTLLPVSDPCAVSCVSEAGKMHYNVKGLLHITDTMLLNNKNLVSKYRDNLWITGDYQVYKEPLMEMCSKKTLNCQSLSRNLLNELKTYLALTNFGVIYKTQIKKCFDKLAADPNLHNEVTYLHDLVFYLPTARMKAFQDLTSIFKQKPDGTKYDFVAIFLMECLEVAPEYLHFTSIREMALAENADFIFPFYVKSSYNQGDDDALKSLFCQQIMEM